jgi:tetratricopeptide (TPR) repeat protein
MTSAPIWKSRPVFITSTFQDMQAERDYLRTHVFPSLEEWLLKTRRHLEWIDLRVGVASATAKAEEERELHVLKVCLAEVKRSRPFLIALIGDRYGWVPPKERIAAAAAEAGFAAEIADRSVTDLEIDFGVFHDKDQQRRCLFFLRAPLPYDKMPPETAAAYSEDYAKDEQAASRRERLIGLKARIRTEFPGRCFEYTAGWKAENVTGLEEFGREVEAKIKQALEEEMSAEPQAAEQSVEDADRAEIADFAEDRARDFVGRQDVLAEIEALIASPAKEDAPWGLCITGEAGSGKSALFGALYQALTGTEKVDALVLAHAAGAGPRAASVDTMLRRWIEELASVLGVAHGLAANAGPDDVEATFARLLGQTAQKRRVIVLLDALDQFEPTARGRHVTWLPRLWHPNARFIATAIPGEATQALGNRLGMTLKPIPPLDAAEARKIAQAITARYHRTLEKEVLDALIAGDKRWTNPLWLVLATEELNLLDADDFARAKQAYTGRDDEKLRALMCNMARDFPPNVPDLYKTSFARASELFGGKLTQAFLGLIAVGRSGWRESDFRVLLPRLSGEEWDELRFAQLRRSFRGQLRRRGGMDQRDFAHAQMRIAAKDWLIETKGPTEVSLHTAIGDHLLALPSDDQLHVSETMVHLMEGENSATRSAQYYGAASLTEAEVAGATRILADIVLTAPNEDTAAGAQRVMRLLETSDVPDAFVGTFAHRLMFDLYDAIVERTALHVKFTLAAAVNAALTRLTAVDPGNADWQRDLSVSYERIGNVLVAQGNLPEAMKAFREGLAIAERLARDDPGDAGWQRNLSVLYDRIGDVLVAQGNLPEALKASRDSLPIAERLARGDPDNACWLRNLSVSWIKMGDVLVAQGNLPEALKAFHNSHTIFELLARANPGSAVWQRDLSVSYERIGNVLVAQGNLPEALKFFRDGLAIAERLARGDPGNADWQRDLSVLYDRIGDVLVAQGNLPEALKAFRDSHAISERLTRGDPDNAGWQRDLSVSYGKIGEVLVAQGNLPEALKFFRDGLAIAERLARGDPGNAGWQCDLSISWKKIGGVLVAQGNQPDALKAFHDSLAIREGLTRLDPSNVVWQRDALFLQQRIMLIHLRRLQLLHAWSCWCSIFRRIMEMAARGQTLR